MLFRLGYDVDVYWVSPEGIKEHLAHYHAHDIDWLYRLDTRKRDDDGTSYAYMAGFRVQARDLIPLLLEGPPEWKPMQSPYGVIGGPVDEDLAERIPDADWLTVVTVDTS